MTNLGTHTVVGLFEDERTAQAVADELTRNGFSRDRVHLSSSANYPSDVAAGGAGLTGRAPAAQKQSGGFMGWLESIFGSDEHEDTSHYNQAVQRGGYVVAVDTDDTTQERAVEIMDKHGAVDIDEHAAKHGYAATERAGEALLAGKTHETTHATGAIPVVEEQLNVGKRAVQRGGVRVYSRVVDQPVHEDVQLRHEKVTVERTPVNRPLTDADRVAMRDQTFEVTEMAEEAVINKQARVVEEVRVGKQATETTQRVSDTVRRTEVRTENIGAGQGLNYTDDFRKDFQTRYASTGGQYETYAPAYEYGYRTAGDAQHHGKSWDEVEANLRTDYLRNNPNGTWDQVKGAVRYGWERVTGQR